MKQPVELEERLHNCAPFPVSSSVEPNQSSVTTFPKQVVCAMSAGRLVVEALALYCAPAMLQ